MHAQHAYQKLNDQVKIYSKVTYLRRLNGVKLMKIRAKKSHHLGTFNYATKSKSVIYNIVLKIQVGVGQAESKV